MKKIVPALLVIFALGGLSQLWAQEVQEYPGPKVPLEYVMTEGSTARPAGVCGPDTLAYPNSKSTNLRFLSINTATSGQAFAMYFNCPQEVKVHGFSFFAIAPGQATPLTVTCELYRSGPDSLPVDTPLAMVQVPVDSNGGGFTLADLAIRAQFPAPVTMKDPYIIVVSNPSPNGVSALVNDFDVNDGGGEWLSSVDFSHQTNGNWSRGYAVNVGGTPFDADVLLFPWVEYDMVTHFQVDETCFQAGDTLQFTNLTSPAIFDRMYNQYIVTQTQFQTYTWDFGDFTGFVNARDAAHTYPTAGPYTATLVTNQLGWSMGLCTDAWSLNIGTPGTPYAWFSFNQNGAYVDFMDGSSGAYAHYWDFGDGTTSNLVNPSHYYAANGTYVVTLGVENTCGTDTVRDTITINCVKPQAAWTWSQFFFQATFTNNSNDATAYLWDFGDGNTSTQPSPSHAYAAYGNYVVSLIVSSNCGTDTLRDTVNMENPVSRQEAASQSGFELLPNPSTGKVRIEAAPSLWSANRLSIFDAMGREVKQLAQPFAQGANLELDLGSLEPGIYFVRVATAQRATAQRLILLK